MERIPFLWQQYLAGTATVPEVEELFALVKMEGHEELHTEMAEMLYVPGKATNVDLATAERVVQRVLAPALGDISSRDQLATPTADLKSAASLSTPSPSHDNIPPTPRIHFLKTAWFRYAVALLLIAGTATFLYLDNKPQKEIAKVQSTEKPDIQPGGNRALLTLADGSTITLDSAAIGSLAEQSGTKILKLDAGKLAYHADNATAEIQYNTVSTPKGGQYQVVLPDGSKVWLNALSSIRFPTVFAKDRKVTVTGEVYFEIARDMKKPFFVSTTGSNVQVLGTSFNVNGYENEPYEKITLLEGSIKVLSVVNQQSAILTPGEGASVKTGIQIKKVNAAKTVAWKNGVFNLTDADIHTLMRQLERWYGITVEYKGNITTQLLQGSIERALPLSEVLNGLEQMGNIHFHVQGNKVTVLP